jgi:DNA replication and repair protein RecF
MALSRLDITTVRNLRAVSLRELAATNIFFGDNGTGKTTVLESLYLLGMARSFRSGHIKTVISHGETSCAVYGELARHGSSSLSLGVSRDLNGGLQAKIAGSAALSTSELAANLPLQIINSDSFNLLVGSPGHRRQFLDWGVFHVEPLFYTAWQRYQRALKQRNSLLRHGKISEFELQPWDKELSEAGELVDNHRRQYFAELQPGFQALIERLSPDLSRLELRYRRGWDKQASLRDVLIASEHSDRQQGFTHAGPQRADIRVVIDGHNAADILSRGQQKLVVCALKLAQGGLLATSQRKACVYLVDDLPAELDKNHCRLVAEVLVELDTQVFITCVERKEVADVWPDTTPGGRAMFHVEHGRVLPNM